jgi:hypothetical protein
MGNNSVNKKNVEMAYKTYFKKILESMDGNSNYFQTSENFCLFGFPCLSDFMDRILFAYDQKGILYL